MCEARLIKLVITKTIWLETIVWTRVKGKIKENSNDASLMSKLSMSSTIGFLWKRNL